VISLSSKFEETIHSKDEKTSFKLSTKRNYGSLFYDRNKDIEDHSVFFIHSVYIYIYIDIYIDRYTEGNANSRQINGNVLLTKHDRLRQCKKLKTQGS
jgi:hypothetical protein